MAASALPSSPAMGSGGRLAHGRGQALRPLMVAPIASKTAFGPGRNRHAQIQYSWGKDKAALRYRGVTLGMVLFPSTLEAVWTGS